MAATGGTPSNKVDIYAVKQVAIGTPVPATVADNMETVDCTPSPRGEGQIDRVSRKSSVGPVAPAKPGSKARSLQLVTELMKPATNGLQADLHQLPLWCGTPVTLADNTPGAGQLEIKPTGQFCPPIVPVPLTIEWQYVDSRAVRMPDSLGIVESISANAGECVAVNWRFDGIFEKDFDTTLIGPTPQNVAAVESLLGATLTVTDLSGPTVVNLGCVKSFNFVPGYEIRDNECAEAQFGYAISTVELTGYSTLEVVVEMVAPSIADLEQLFCDGQALSVSLVLSQGTEILLPNATLATPAPGDVNGIATQTLTFKGAPTAAGNDQFCITFNP